MGDPGRAAGANDVDEQLAKQGVGRPVVRRVEERAARGALLDLLERERDRPGQDLLALRLHALREPGPVEPAEAAPAGRIESS